MKLANVNFAILDQGCISGSNFFISVFLARVMTPEEFGLYVFAISVLTFCVGFMNSIVCTPISVFGSAVSKIEWKKLVTNGCFLFLITVVIVLFILVLSSEFLNRFKYVDNGHAILLISAIVVFFLGHELIRRILISRLQNGRAFLLDTVVYGLRILLILALVWSFSIKYNIVLYIIGITSGVGAALGIISSKEIIRFDNRLDSAMLGRIWGFGKWTLADWVPFVVSGQLYIYIVALLLGNSANGVLGACRNLIAPVSILMVGIMNFAIPYFSKIYNDSGHEEFLRVLKKFSLVILGLVLCYLTIIVLEAENLLNYIFQKYSENGSLVSLFSIGVFINFAFKPADIYLKVTLKPKAVFKSRILAAIASAVLCYPMVSKSGLIGAVLCYICAQVTMCIFMYLFMFRSVRNIQKFHSSK